MFLLIELKVLLCWKNANRCIEQKGIFSLFTWNILIQNWVQKCNYKEKTSTICFVNCVRVMPMVSIQKHRKLLLRKVISFSYSNFFVILWETDEFHEKWIKWSLYDLHHQIVRQALLFLIPLINTMYWLWSRYIEIFRSSIQEADSAISPKPRPLMAARFGPYERKPFPGGGSGFGGRPSGFERR